MLKLDGYFDLHLHSAPAPFVRIADSADIAKWCANAGMAGIVIKSHFESTVSKVHHARLAVADTHPDFKVFSSITLNRGVGGINPGAVDLALQQGAKVVWLPTLDAAAHAAAYGAGGTYGFKAMTIASRRKSEYPVLSTVDERGKLKSETKEVIDLVNDYGAILGTGHISKAEIFAIADYAFGIGLKRVVITHPELATPNLDVAAMVELAKMGATMEFCAVNLLPKFHCLSLKGLIEALEAVTPDRAILSSDGGQPFNPQPHECIRIIIQSLFDSGYPIENIDRVCRDNQRALLDLA